MNKKWIALVEILAAVCFVVSYVFQPDTAKLALACVWLLAFSVCCFRISKEVDSKDERSAK